MIGSLIGSIFVVAVAGGIGIFFAWLDHELRGVRRNWPTLTKKRRPPEPPTIHPPDARPYPWRPWS